MSMSTQASLLNLTDKTVRMKRAIDSHHHDGGRPFLTLFWLSLTSVHLMTAHSPSAPFKQNTLDETPINKCVIFISGAFYLVEALDRPIVICSCLTCENLTPKLQADPSNYSFAGRLRSC